MEGFRNPKNNVETLFCTPLHVLYTMSRTDQVYVFQDNRSDLGDASSTVFVFF